MKTVLFSKKVIAIVILPESIIRDLQETKDFQENELPDGIFNRDIVEGAFESAQDDESAETLETLLDVIDQSGATYILPETIQEGLQSGDIITPEVPDGETPVNYTRNTYASFIAAELKKSLECTRSDAFSLVEEYPAVVEMGWDQAKPISYVHDTILSMCTMKTETIKEGDTVLVPDGNADDEHLNEFVGEVVGFKDCYAHVRDADNDVYVVLTGRLSLYKEEKVN